MTGGRSVIFSGYSGFLHHDITEILLKVAFNTITLTPVYSSSLAVSYKATPSLEWDNLIFSLRASEIWPDKRRDLIVLLYQILLHFNNMGFSQSIFSNLLHISDYMIRIRLILTYPLSLLYPRSPKGEGGILFYLCSSVLPSFRPSKIFFVAFF